MTAEVVKDGGMWSSLADAPPEGNCAHGEVDRALANLGSLTGARCGVGRTDAERVEEGNAVKTYRSHRLEKTHMAMRKKCLLTIH